MPEAKIAVVGLASAGKTVFHATLWGCPSPTDKPDITINFPAESDRLLEGIWDDLARGTKPPPTDAVRQAVIEWDVEQPRTRRRWTIRTMDAAGEFYRSTRKADLAEAAGEIDRFLDGGDGGCDAILYFIDPMNEADLRRQLGLLRRLLESNKVARTPRPVALVFTKADQYIPSFDHLTLDDARVLLPETLRQTVGGQQFHHFYCAQCNDLSLYQTFLISCLRPTPSGVVVNPRFIHEPIFWAIDQIHWVRRRGVRRRVRRVLGVAAAVAGSASLALGGVWLHYHRAALRETQEVHAWCEAHPGAESAGERHDKLKSLLGRSWARRPFVSDDFLARQRDAATRAAYDLEFQQLLRRLDELPGGAKARARLAALDAHRWTAQPGPVPADILADFDRRRQAEREAVEDDAVRVLFAKADRDIDTTDAPRVRGELLASEFRSGRHKAEFDRRIELAAVNAIRSAAARQDPAVPDAAAAFFREYPTSAWRKQVEKLHDDWAWEFATGAEDDVRLPFSDRIRRYEDYLRIGYANRKSGAEVRIASLRERRDRSDR